jgi:hypothetical protein
MSKQSASTRAYTAAGGEQVGILSGPAVSDGPATPLDTHTPHRDSAVSYSHLRRMGPWHIVPGFWQKALTLMATCRRCCCLNTSHIPCCKMWHPL